MSDVPAGEITRVIGYIGRASADRRTLTSVWFDGRARGVYFRDRLIGSLTQVRYESDGRIVGRMNLIEPEPTDAWPVLNLDNVQGSFHRGRVYLSGEIIGASYDPRPAWPQLREAHPDPGLPDTHPHQPTPS